ncbi:MAG: hypothetical protein FK733_12315 [Asgard group archaeon]|nr:hypothetical protein [Asgard group archaeon]
MADALTWIYAVFSWITTAATFGLVIALFNNFLRKKTTGTLILFTSYLIIALSAAVGAVVYNLQAIELGGSVVRILQTISTLAPQIGLLLIYIFSCRHILKDNEVTKSLTLMVATFILGVVFMFYIFGLFGTTAPIDSEAWYALSTNNPTPYLENISIGILSMLLVLIQIYINSRIFIRAFVLSRRTDKLIRKRGLLLIAWGLVIYLTSGIIITLELSVDWGSIGLSSIQLVFWMLRKIGFVASYIFLYLGWIMPDWFRRRIRGKTWFESRYKEISKFAQQ